jgi:hypothetical protein
MCVGSSRAQQRDEPILACPLAAPARLARCEQQKQFMSAHWFFSAFFRTLACFRFRGSPSSDAQMSMRAHELLLSDTVSRALDSVYRQECQELARTS